MKSNLIQLTKMTLTHCYEKIRLYNENNQEYLGGVEATRLLSNIRDNLRLLNEFEEKMEIVNESDSNNNKW